MSHGVVSDIRTIRGRAGGNREQELAWIREHEVQYREQWVAIEGNELVASGEQYREVRGTAMARGIETPFLTYIPTEPLINFMGL
jgi:hypothetical protein